MPTLLWAFSLPFFKDLIYNLRPEEFEDWVGLLLKKLGYEKIQVVGGIHKAGGGFDVKLEFLK